MTLRLFTPAEASTALPDVRRHTERLVSSRADQIAAHARIAELDAGLVDFPARRDGEQVFLCWQLGERDVAWWHGLDEGFRGRKPL